MNEHDDIWTTGLPVRQDEPARLASLAEYGIHEPLEDPGFERLLCLAQRLFGVSTALVSLVEAQRQLFAVRAGLSLCETPRQWSFCAHALGSEDLLVVPDARLDSRFAANPLVLGPPHIRFYAGCPLVSPQGFVLGTLCLIDQAPRPAGLDAEASRNLRDLAALVMDKLEWRRLAQARQVSQACLESMARHSPDAIFCLDAEGGITFQNGSGRRLLARLAPGKCDTAGRVPARILAVLRTLFDRRDSAAEEAGIAELELEDQAGQTLLVEMAASRWGVAPQASCCVVLRDVTERRRNEAKLYQLAHIDALTGLPNRVLFRSRLDALLRDESAVSVMMLDLDGFKDVNDSLGHPGGDAVLKETARRLLAGVRETDVVARMGGDEFALLIRGMREEAGRLAAELIDVLSRPMLVEGQPVTVGASVGIALFPEHGTGSQELLSGADLALYLAKSEGRHGWRFFSPSLRDAAAARRAYQAELERAFSQGELVLHYQPLVRLADNALTGAEALLRWRHPERGLLGAAAFLPALQSSPLAGAVGNWALQEACAQAVAWRRRVPGLRMSVNVFPAQFRRGDLVERVAGALHQAGLAPEALELEVRDDLVARHDEALLVVMRAIRELGVGLVFDDYGTGHASLNMLKQYPLSRLKIDRSFVRGIPDSPADAAIVRAILYLGRSLGMAVTAEGVENPVQFERLRRKGCEEAQGYYLGPPVAPADFSAYLESEVLRLGASEQLSAPPAGA
ncbi:diguanylate cyclase/phosphodiesterase (GGDEF & EAL domains) with PAS/PAC sensor(s) [plant metagenome]|uniref:Diguanylate cyclase/phosphodiesterase (GGDEF & EAL domains) with PAS/PAC sensor(S) n=1 Tax=plant metagenome TaxID=1297885 RepID=A0A484RKN4_9ZZZZ